MSAADVRRVIRSFHALSPTGTIHLSTWGEIALHHEVEEILSIAKEVDGADFLVETSGVGWNPEVVDRVVNREFPDIIWIVTLDAYREEVYRQVRGEGFHEAVDFAKRLLERFSDKVYLQSTRMNENEEDLESFYREWKKVTPNVVIQKYDHFSGRLPDRRVVDNAPVVRLPCWHLKRDISVLVDGTVPLCREDLDIEHRLGNALTEDLEEIWERGAPLYQKHIRKEYPRLCTACDEYYTFNF